ncbi:MAG: family 16 glycosylhydrolase [Haliscomenobacter sp.]
MIGKITAMLSLFALTALLAVSCQLSDETEGYPSYEAPLLSWTSDKIELTEGNQVQKIQVPIALSGTNLNNVVVRYATRDGSAKAGSDFIAIEKGSLLFGPSNREKTIEVTILADQLKEEDEYFELIIQEVLNGKPGTIQTLRITIRNDDFSPIDFISIPTGGTSSPKTYTGYKLVWEEEFEGTTLDPQSWTYELGDGCPNCGWGNNELQFYQRENILMDKGFLVIQAKKERAGSKDYTSSRIITKGKREFQYGRMDIRAALPGGRGLWPAIWMLGANIDKAAWPACGEIDIMELTGDKPSRIIGTAHFGANVAQHQFRTAATFLNAGTFSDAFHVFSIVWEKDRIRWLLDDTQYFELTPAQLNGQAYPFNQPFFFILNVAVGGNLPGSPNATTVFPASMIIDYIRVFQVN